MSALAPPLWFWRVLAPPLWYFAPRVGTLFQEGLVLGLNSWWRDIAGNANAGGDPFSQHLFGLAADLQTQHSAALIRRASQLGLQAFPISQTAVHVQLYPAGTLARFGITPSLIPPNTN